MHLTFLPLAILLALAIVGFFGCERKPVATSPGPAPVESEPVAKTKTFETARLGAAIDGFEKQPSERNAAAVKKALANLDEEIGELHERIARTTGPDRDEAAVKARNLESYRTGENLRFQKAQAGMRSGNPAADGRTGAAKIEDGARRVGEKVEAGARKVGDTVEDAAKKAGDAIKDATR